MHGASKSTTLNHLTPANTKNELCHMQPDQNGQIAGRNPANTKNELLCHMQPDQNGQIAGRNPYQWIAA